MTCALAIRGNTLFVSPCMARLPGMNSTRCLIAASAFLLLTSVSATRAELRWDQFEQRFRARPQDRFIETKYRFTNVGNRAVTIDMILTSCGCTTTALTKMVYQPGESGELGVRYDFDASSGHQEKSILVTTSDGSRPAELRLVVDLSASIEGH
jgi:hypothetical protein